MRNHMSSEQRIRNNRIRRKRQLRRNILTLMLTCALIVTCFVLLDSKAKAQGNEEEHLYKYYKSVTVSCKDTLWDYAGDFAHDRFYEDYRAYIDEVIHINALQNETITAGQHIILPYYSAEFR